MKYQYKIQNFRVFDEEGVKLDMAPITILTGCNSSGKSSFVKSMLLVNGVLKKLSSKGFLYTGQKLDFTEKPNNLLGSFENVIHRGSESKNITVEYTVPSLFLNEDVSVTMVFNRHGKLNGGELSHIKISRADGTIMFDCEPDGSGYPGCDNVICHSDLRTPFFKYVFAANNRILLSGIQDGGIYDYFEKKGKNISSLDKLEKAKAYYNSNKDWIDKIISEIPEGSLVPNTIKKYHKQTITSGFINISNEQIYKENLLYAPVLDTLLTTTSNDFASKARSVIENVEHNEMYELTLCIIQSVEKDFIESKFDKFSDYFSHVYNDFFIYSSDIDKHIEFGIHEMLSCNNRFTGYAISSEELRENVGNNALADLYNLLKLLTGTSNSKSFKEIYNIQYPNWYVAYNDYRNLVVEEILSYRIPTDISYIPTSLVNIKRLYSFDEKDEMTELLKKYILSQENYTKMSWGYSNKWLRKLNIGEKIRVNAIANGIGCEVRITKDDDDYGQLLADFGYGISQIIFLLIRIELEANRYCPIVMGDTAMDYETKEEYRMRVNYKKPLTIVLEEPEVHLHPKFQSMIADILLDAYNEFNFHFIIETHSEYLIRRSQVLVSKMGFENNVESVVNSPFITYYMPENSKPYSLGYRKDGKFMESFGPGFYDEASNLAFELL